MTDHPAPDAAAWLRTGSAALTERAARVEALTTRTPPPLDEIGYELGQLMAQAEKLRAAVAARTATAAPSHVGVTQARADFGSLAESVSQSGVFVYLTRRGRRHAALVPAPVADALAPPATVDVVSMEHVREHFAAVVRAAYEGGRCTVVARHVEANRYVAIVPVALVEAAGGKES